MIPISLRISGFLSYRAPTEIDFTSFDLACISGSNGAGKSSLLDAMTWALFGQARKRDASLINLQSQVAKVIFTFEYEGNIYRIIRTLPRKETASLEFQILDRAQTAQGGRDVWQPLTERTLRETQARIEQILRLDYETFVNAAFFLQGKADLFAQQPPARRKEILSNILGLEIWEEYRQRAAEQRKRSENELAAIEGRLEEIAAELAEEADRRHHLAELETRLQQLRATRQAQESALEAMQRIVAALDQQRHLVQTLKRELERAREDLQARQKRLEAKQKERADLEEILARAAEIEHAYTTWQQARQEIDAWNRLAEQHRALDERRQPYLQAIAGEKARLEQEKTSLEEQAVKIAQQRETADTIGKDLAAKKGELARIELSLSQRPECERQLQATRQKQAELRAENERLKAEMDELKERMDRLSEMKGATCPLCGQSLSSTERAALMERLKAEGKAKGDAWRANKVSLETLAAQIEQLESEQNACITLEQQQQQLSIEIAQLTERLEAVQRQNVEWESGGALRLREVTRLLTEEDFAHQARQALAEIARALAALGYDIQAHEAARQRENDLRAVEETYRQLESARAATRPLDDEIANLMAEIIALQSEVQTKQEEYETAQRDLSIAESQAPDVEAAERALLDLQEEENRLHGEVGAARQRVEVLDKQRVRKKELEAEREEIRRRIGHYKILERAFGKDGVPALLIEQALPEIEARANALLDRLSDGQMRVRFLTQTAYKDQRRDDLRETLEIQISDGAGVRAYELYSGGEAFRVNFALRVALAEMLTHRKGARLQTLVIDEGFGSQDTQGRQRLIEAINSIRQDFAKILIITHLDDLKDAFPARIEVEKTADGSHAHVR